MRNFRTLLLALVGAVMFSGAAQAIKIEIILDNDELYSAAKRSFHDGKLEDAAYYYSEALRRNALSDDETVIAHSDLCVTLLFLEKFDEAIAQCETALDLRPNRWETLNNLGTVYLVQGDYGNALQAFERALAMKPGSPILKANKQLTLRRASEAAAETADSPTGGAKPPEAAAGAVF
jgi:tetratricopeptide (TPR) repeat protein